MPDENWPWVKYVLEGRLGTMGPAGIIANGVLCNDPGFIRQVVTGCFARNAGTAHVSWEKLAIRTSQRNPTRLSAWIVILLASPLPDILLNEWLALGFGWLIWAKLTPLVLAFGLSWVARPFKPLRWFILMLLALLALEYGRSWAATTTWQGWFDGAGAGFVQFMLGNQLLKVAVALLILVLLVIVGFRPGRAYLKQGQFDAPVEPVRFLVIKEGEVGWRRFGWLSALALGAGTLLFPVLSGTLQVRELPQLIPLFPAILLSAAMNAFAEGARYRVALLAPLRGYSKRDKRSYSLQQCLGRPTITASPTGSWAWLWPRFLAGSSARAWWRLTDTSGPGSSISHKMC